MFARPVFTGERHLALSGSFRESLVSLTRTSYVSVCNGLEDLTEPAGEYETAAARNDGPAERRVR